MLQPTPIALESLAEVATAFVREHESNLNETYRWEIPFHRMPDWGFERGGDSLARANARLKRFFGTAGTGCDTTRATMEAWYVSVWGRITGNKPERLAYYSATSSSDLTSASINGVASWSKILSIRDPDVYPIYDARVGTVLEMLQIIADTSTIVVFPRVPSRNESIKEFRRRFRSSSKFEQKVSAENEAAYRRYMELVATIMTDADIPSANRVEMTLFANLEALQSKARARLLGCSSSTSPL